MDRIKALLMAIALVVAASLTSMNSAQAQSNFDPRIALAQVIQTLQTGQDAWIYELMNPAILEIIRTRTQGTGIYLRLRELQAVQNVEITSQMELPRGIIYGMRATHSQGVSDWFIGFGNENQTIEYLTFKVISGGGPTASLPPPPDVTAGPDEPEGPSTPDPQDQPDPAPDPQPDPQPDPAPTTDSDEPRPGETEDTAQTLEPIPADEVDGCTLYPTLC